MKFSFLFSCSENLMNPVFSYFRFYSSARKYCPQTMIKSASQRSIPTTVKIGSSTRHKTRSIKLLDYQFGYFRLPRGLPQRTQHCRSMARARYGMCELKRQWVIEERHGHGMLCVNLLLGIQHVMCMRRIILSLSWTGLSYYQHYIIPGMIFEKQLLS